MASRIYVLFAHSIKYSICVVYKNLSRVFIFGGFFLAIRKTFHYAIWDDVKSSLFFKNSILNDHFTILGTLIYSHTQSAAKSLIEGDL